MSLYAFHLGQIISTVLGQVDHDGQHGNAARTPIRDETSETDHTQNRRFRHSAIYQTIQALAILRCLYGSEMVVLGVVLGKCEMPSTEISQENDHARNTHSQTSICGLQLQINSSGSTLPFFLNLFNRKIIGTYLIILSLFWCKIVNIL
jgi:hypothetical protein